MERDGWLHFTETNLPYSPPVPLLASAQSYFSGKAPSSVQDRCGKRDSNAQYRIISKLSLTMQMIQVSRDLITSCAVEFGNWFRWRCNEAGLPHCSAHGLRKCGATIAANNGATEHQLMAIYGWENPKQAAHYTRKANRKKLAADAMHLVDPDQTGNKTVAPLDVVREGATISAKKS